MEHFLQNVQTAPLELRPLEARTPVRDELTGPLHALLALFLPLRQWVGTLRFPETHVDALPRHRALNGSRGFKAFICDSLLVRLDVLDMAILRALHEADEATSTTLALKVLPDNGKSLQARDSKMRHRLQALEPFVQFHRIDGKRHWTLNRDLVRFGKLTARLKQANGSIYEVSLGESIVLSDEDGVLILGTGH